MATIQELEQKIQRLEKQILANDLKVRELLEKSEKAMECAKHAYKVDHYGFIWVWDVNKGEYRKSNMRVMTPEIADRALESRNIADNAIEGRHMTDNLIEGRMIKNRTIEGRSIQDDAIGTEQIKDGSITGDSMCPGALPNGKLADDAVAERNIQNHNVTKDKLSTELINLIYSAGAHGYHLSDQFGDNPEIGVSQNALTRAFNNLWLELEQITGRTILGFTWSINPGYFISETAETIHVAIQPTNPNDILEHVALYADDVLVGEASDVTEFELDIEMDKTTVLKCVAKVLGVPYTRRETVIKYSEFYIGGGDSTSDVMTVEHAQQLNGTMRHAVDVAVPDGKHIIIVIGESLRSGFIRADMSGMEIPFTEESVTIEGKNYKVLTSQNTYEAGTYNIDING